MTTQAIPVGPVERFVLRFSRMLSGGSFAMFALFVLAFYETFVMAMTFAPIGGGAMGGFLEEFRIRCFQFEPKTGWMQWSSVATMIAEPLPLAGIIWFIWRAQIRELWQTRRRAVLPLASAALLLVGVLGAGLAGVGNPEPPQKELPFPADTLRSALPMPAFKLTNQDGQMVSLADLKGRVTLVTAVYATCTTTCPMMLKGIRTVLDELTPAERAKLSVVAFSLSPETDTKELRTMITQAYHFDSAQFNFLNGQPDEMNALLNQLNIARTRDPKTGELVHSAMFILLDREGRIAYRLSLSQRESSWLITAVRTLLAEKTP
jgi:cytochrome oxidase Cu insertion factor (SCO1/SenC/PrrC family)